MRFNKLDLNLLVALDVLLVERNITRAAERLHMSQSAMSGALARLRDYFEDDLLVQVGRRMDLTPRAETLREAVRDVLMRIDTSLAAQPAFDCTQTDREFKLLVSDYTGAVLMPMVVNLAQRQRSTAKLWLLPQAQNPARALERGDADLLVIPTAFCSPDHPTEVVFSDEFVCAVWEGSSHVRQGLDFKRYMAAGHLVMQPAENNASAFEMWFTERYGLSRRIEVRSFSFTTLPLLLEGTELIFTAHAKLVRRLRGALPLKFFRVPMPMPPLEQSMQWHKYRTQDPGLLWLRRLLRQSGDSLEASLPPLDIAD